MYIPKHFNIEDKDVIYDVINKYGFATLFSMHDGLPCATHLPLIVDRKKAVLIGHFARPNKQWRDIENQEVLAVFNGPHSYISPSWYETNHAVPTWNYVTVHVYGTINLMDNNDEDLLSSMKEMTLKYEEPTSSYKIQEIENDFLEGMKKGVVGFHFRINRIEGKAKLSQNHPEDRQNLVIKNLEKNSSDNSQGIAALMRKNLNNN